MQASAEQIWNSAQGHLRSMLSPDIYNLWFAPLRPVGMDAQHVTLEVANDFCEVWLKENYLTLLQDMLGVASGRALRVKFKTAESNGFANLPVEPAKEASSKPKAIEASADR